MTVDIGSLEKPAKSQLDSYEEIQPESVRCLSARASCKTGPRLTAEEIEAAEEEALAWARKSNCC